MTSIALSSPTDWAGFSRAVRALGAEGVAPEDVRWVCGESTHGDLFETDSPRDAHALPLAPALRLPKAFVEPAREVFLHASDERLPLLHRMALRLAAEPDSWADPLHVDRLQFDRFQREVRREIHKMHAFVRFRRIDEDVPAEADDEFQRALDDAFDGESRRGGASAGVAGLADDRVRASGAAWGSEVESAPGAAMGAAGAGRASAQGPRHVAWFEPEHHVVEAAAPFFARRFATMRWAILTPRVSVEWDGRALAFGPGARREDAPGADAGEALWLAYYRSIFNPARVKVAMMKKEMPVRFWKNLPEAGAIGTLLADAPARQRQMIAAGGAQRLRRRAGAEAGSEVGTASTDIAAGACGGDGHGIGDAAAAHAMPASLDALRRAAARCRDCPVADAATQTVFGEGSAQARLMIVGEQPGDREDLVGRPFQGPAGQLLDDALHELGWDRAALYLTNAVKHFHHDLRGKRRMHKTPGQQEAEACLHWLESEIAALRPAAIVALGATAARSLLGRDVGVLAHEGEWFHRPDGLPVLVCLHPAAILRAEESRQPGLWRRWVETLRGAASIARPQGEAIGVREIAEPRESAAFAGVVASANATGSAQGIRDVSAVREPSL